MKTSDGYPSFEKLNKEGESRDPRSKATIHDDAMPHDEPPAAEINVVPSRAESIAAEILMANVGLEAAKKAAVDILETLEICEENGTAVYEMWDAIRFELNQFKEL